MTPDELAAAKAEQIKMEALDAWEACDHPCLTRAEWEDFTAFDLRYQAFTQGYIAGRAANDAELARLRAVVERLPKLGDGQPAVPGTTVYRRCNASNGEVGELTVSNVMRACGYVGHNERWVDVLVDGTCYSTRAAAIGCSAAKGGV